MRKDIVDSNIIKLSNSKVEFCFEKETCSLIQIRNVENDTQFLSILRGARLFRLIIPSESWPTRYADSHEGQKPVVNLEKNSLTIYYEDIICEGSPTGIQATVKVNLPDDSYEARFSLLLENRSSFEVEEVRFPWVGGFESVSGPGKDNITVASKSLDPHNLFPQENPHTFVRWRKKLAFEYPYPLLLPYMDISGDGNGLGYICYLNEPRFGVIGFERLDPFGRAPSLSWSWASSPFVKPGEVWQSPEVGISIHQGDWHETADRFRGWVDTWWRSPSPPQKLTNSIGLMNLQCTSFDGEEIFRFDNLPGLAKECLEAGIKDICLWHRAGGLYTVNGSKKEIMDLNDEELDKLRYALTQVNEMGINMSIILNLRLVKRIMKPFELYGETEAMRCKDGSPVSEENYSGSPYHLANLGPHYNKGDVVTLCQRPGSKFVDRAETLIQKMIDLGFKSIFIDQPVNMHCCFAEQHGHPAPDAAPQAAIEWLKEVAVQVKSANDEAYVIGELPELFQTQQIDLWWHWQWLS